MKLSIKKLKSLKSSASGFTLVEVLVAMIILALGLLAMAAMTIVVLSSNVLSKQISESVRVASHLMDSLKLQPLANLPDCTTTITIGSTCKILKESGVENIAEFYPSTQNSVCGIQGLLDTGATTTFDTITNDLSGGTNFTASDDICGLTNTTLGNGEYIRYYRTFDPDTTNTDTAERTIVVVVLWKDKWGKWKSSRLTTLRTQ